VDTTPALAYNGRASGSLGAAARARPLVPAARGNPRKRETIDQQRPVEAEPINERGNLKARQQPITRQPGRRFRGCVGCGHSGDLVAVVHRHDSPNKSNQRGAPGFGCA
jgi:hypothetical protein